MGLYLVGYTKEAAVNISKLISFHKMLVTVIVDTSLIRDNSIM